MFFQCKVNKLRIYLFEDKLKMNIRNRFAKSYIHRYFGNCKFTMEFIKERGICLKINVELIFEVWE